jgi:hypothetical protein
MGGARSNWGARGVIQPKNRKGGVRSNWGVRRETVYIFVFLRSLIHFFSLFFLSQSHVLHSSTTHEFSGGGAAAGKAAPPPEKKKIPLFFKKKSFF